MDLTKLLNDLAQKLPMLADEDRAVIETLMDHMHAGVIRPVTDDERALLIQLGGGAQ